MAKFSLSATLLVLLGNILLMTITAPPRCEAQPPQLIITSDLNDRVLAYDNSGNFLTSLRDGGHRGGAGPDTLAVAPDGRLFLGIGYADMVVQVNPEKKKFKFFTSGGAISQGAQIAFGPDGDLYLANGGYHRVDRYDGTTGEYKGDVSGPAFGGLTAGVAVDRAGNVYFSEVGGSVFKLTGTGFEFFANGLQPYVLLLGPDDLLYIVSRHFQGVFRYKLDGTPYGKNGDTVDPFFASGGGLIDPVGIAMGPDGNLYVTDYASNVVLRYDRISGAPLGVFTQPGPDIQGAWGICFYVPPGALDPLPLPNNISGGHTAQGKVKLAHPAPVGGALVWLYSNKSAASVPISVLVPAGQKSADFTITTTAVTSDTVVKITVSYLGQKRTGTFTVND